MDRYRIIFHTIDISFHFDIYSGFREKLKKWHFSRLNEIVLSWILNFLWIDRTLFSPNTEFFSFRYFKGFSRKIRKTTFFSRLNELVLGWPINMLWIDKEMFFAQCEIRFILITKGIFEKIRKYAIFSRLNEMLLIWFINFI